MEKWREIREKKEESLSRYASKSINSIGRVTDEPQCPLRTIYERDGNRILHSPEFRRLRHKTQVFFNAQNDHICTRMEHVLNVSSIAATITRTLDLNQDLTHAISLGHDLGHAPFGHTGERVIDKCLKNIDPKLGFRHEIHSLRVVDKLAARTSRQNKNVNGLNLSFEVRDGIISHCGEIFGEYKLKRNTDKKPEDIYKINHREHFPYTLEGCVVRIADKIAYVGRDLEDAVKAGIIDLDIYSAEVKNELGNTNSQIINNLVMDIVENSYGRDVIELSDAKGQALKELLNTNNEYIYNSEIIKTYEKNAMNILEGVFQRLYEFVKARDFEKMVKSKINVVNNFYDYIKQIGYDKNEACEQMVVDYVAGMTDNYAMRCYEELYWI